MERCSPSCSSSNQACTAFRTSPILTPRKEAAPLRYLVHHSRVAAVASSFSRNCNLSMRPSNVGADGSRGFIDGSLQSLQPRITSHHSLHPPREYSVVRHFPSSNRPPDGN